MIQNAFKKHSKCIPNALNIVMHRNKREELADSFGIQFMETSAKNAHNVEQASPCQSREILFGSDGLPGIPDHGSRDQAAGGFPATGELDSFHQNARNKMRPGPEPSMRLKDL